MSGPHVRILSNSIAPPSLYMYARLKGGVAAQRVMALGRRSRWLIQFDEDSKEVAAISAPDNMMDRLLDGGDRDVWLVDHLHMVRTGDAATSGLLAATMERKHERPRCLSLVFSESALEVICETVLDCDELAAFFRSLLAERHEKELNRPKYQLERGASAGIRTESRQERRRSVSEKASTSKAAAAAAKAAATASSEAWSAAADTAASSATAARTRAADEAAKPSSPPGDDLLLRPPAAGAAAEVGPKLRHHDTLGDLHEDAESAAAESVAAAAAGAAAARPVSTARAGTAAAALLEKDSEGDLAHHQVNPMRANIKKSAAPPPPAPSPLGSPENLLSQQPPKSPQSGGLNIDITVAVPGPAAAAAGSATITAAAAAASPHGNVPTTATAAETPRAGTATNTAPSVPSFDKPPAGGGAAVLPAASGTPPLPPVTASKQTSPRPESPKKGTSVRGALGALASKMGGGRSSSSKKLQNQGSVVEVNTDEDIDMVLAVAVPRHGSRRGSSGSGVSGVSNGASASNSTGGDLQSWLNTDTEDSRERAA